MRASLDTVVLTGSVFFAVACSQSTSPSGPTPAPSLITTSSSLALPAARQELPFKGKFDGFDTLAPAPPPRTALLITNATGTGTHLGHFSVTQQLGIGGGIDATGTARWVAANGDSIETTVAVVAVPGELVFTLTETHTITGGTGRFSDAQGIFTVHRTHVRAAHEDGSHDTFASFEGTITSPGH